MADLLPRGVYDPKVLTESGHRYLLAVDSQGRCIKRTLYFRGDEREQVAAMLERFLDQQDPVRVSA